MSANPKSLWSVLDDAHILIGEAHDLTELLHMAAERLGENEVGPMQRGADSVLDRLNQAKEMVREAMHAVHGGAK